MIFRPQEGKSGRYRWIFIWSFSLVALFCFPASSRARVRDMDRHEVVTMTLSWGVANESHPSFSDTVDAIRSLGLSVETGSGPYMTVFIFNSRTGYDHFDALERAWPQLLAMPGISWMTVNVERNGSRLVERAQDVTPQVDLNGLNEYIMRTSVHFVGSGSIERFQHDIIKAGLPSPEVASGIISTEVVSERRMNESIVGWSRIAKLIEGSPRLYGRGYFDLRGFRQIDHVQGFAPPTVESLRFLRDHARRLKVQSVCVSAFRS